MLTIAIALGMILFLSGLDWVGALGHKDALSFIGTILGVVGIMGVRR